MNDFQIYVMYPLLYSGITYWGTSAVWFLFDIFVAPSYRIHGGEIIDWKLYGKTAKHVIITQLSTTPFVLYALIPVWKYRGVKVIWSNKLFSFMTIFQLLLCSVIGDLVFYLFHRLCHINLLYSKIHKLHHEWKVPVAVAAAYATKYEYVICNLPTFLLPPLILGIHWYVANVWFIIATFNVVMDHSGYVFFENSIRHAHHHKYTNYNYGAKKFDRISNTEFIDKQYQSSYESSL